MQPRLRQAREAVESASQLTDDATVHEQLNSIDRALGDLSGKEALDDSTEEGDRLEDIERQLVELGNGADGLAKQHIETARDHLDEFRRVRAPDWE